MKHALDVMRAAAFAAFLSTATVAGMVPAWANAQAIVQPGDRTSGQSDSTLVLAENGKALQPIVIAADASDNIKATAEYLAEKLGKMAGTKFEVQTGDGSSGIVLGTIAQFPTTSLQKPLEIRPLLDGVDIKNGVEAYGIRTEAKRVLVLGGGEQGASHAAARLLELLGYRRYYPAREWEIAPQQNSLRVNRNETDRPNIPARHIWYAFGGPVEPSTVEVAASERTMRSNTDLPAWYRQNRLGESFRVFAAHHYAAIAAALQDEFAAHPEYRMLIDGERSPRGICTSQPVVRAMGAKLALAYFANNPDADMYSMERGDGSITCECELCQAQGNESNRVFGFANYVAREVRQEYPGKMIGVLAYNTHDVTPDFPLEPNVHVQVARLFIQSGHTFRELVEMWSQKTKNLGVYDYFSTFQWGQDRLRSKNSAGPTGDISLLKSDIPFLADQGILSHWSESSVAWGAHGRGKLVAARLMWNPQADVDAVLQDFYETSFGPAAPAMKRYFERVDGGSEFFSRTLLGLAFRDVDEAARLAKDRPDVLARLDHIKQFLIYNYIITRTMEGTPEERKRWFLELLTHEFRTRYAYLTHWHARTNFLSSYATTYNEPSWTLPGWKDVAAAQKEGRTIPLPPWQKEPYTRPETEARFQEGLQFFQPQTVLPRVTFSDDLVPVEFPNAPSAVASRQAHSGSGTVYLYSLQGEPLEIAIKAAVSGDPALYTLRDRKGEHVQQSELPQDDQEHALRLQVPAPGLYRFTYEGRGWWGYAVPQDRANTVLLPMNPVHWNQTLEGLGGRSFFYVPRGTRQFQFYWSGGSHSVLGPDNKVVQIVTTVNDYVTIDVPEGMDGHPWSFTGRWDNRQFINIPSYIAPTPNALLVPRELAEKDGLVIRR